MRTSFRQTAFDTLVRCSALFDSLNEIISGKSVNVWKGAERPIMTLNRRRQGCPAGIRRVFLCIVVDSANIHWTTHTVEFASLKMLN